ncbi:VWA domain-containing protein [Lederbergia wuyishanensis]|uniref:D-amino-acid dehydrogenase/Ca-activated chloride channel family protein n=1 Tax=Lederbergia wuyishanensis TaxID=1347903 RepID=A0ABU0DAC9_9BACI|nr:VWA domain-containing protein [Lederbergia wuyishanensis]MCJ8009965.1 VWA domain-containing protein [Lederbergia wuyishanensis]MDQ0345313.1 D-amino-acid dehydrogenase/Ca-activated chloride channel family protein [Lederbergia wuyishanensis]
MKKFWIGLFFASIFLGGCSSDEKDDNKQVSSKNQIEEVEENEEVAQVTQPVEEYIPKEVNYFDIKAPDQLTDLEKEMLRHPGIFSGEQYDEAKVNEALDQLPDNLTPEQYLEELKYLFAEDYHEELETLLHFDSSVKVNIDRPDESIDTPKLKKAHFAILIDASGSMKAMSGNKTRMEAAKEAVQEFAEQIPEEATISMRVYGHKGSGGEADKKLSCSSTESLYNGTFDNSKFQKSLQKVQPAGWTPIGLVLEKVKEDIPKDADDVVVYVVSDGIETCGGDPVKAAKALATDEIETVVNIIGFDVDNEGQKLLKEVASAGNGEFTYVSSERDLKEYMKVQYEEIKMAWIKWKNEGKLETVKVKQEKEQLAVKTKLSLEQKAVREKQRMESAQNYLKKRFSEIGHPISEVYSMVVEYGSSKYTYAVENGAKAYLETVESGSKQFQEYEEEGSKKIEEMDEKKNE